MGWGVSSSSATRPASVSDTDRMRAGLADPSRRKRPLPRERSIT
jgi:hypothetical protein